LIVKDLGVSTPNDRTSLTQLGAHVNDYSMGQLRFLGYRLSAENAGGICNICGSHGKFFAGGPSYIMQSTFRFPFYIKGSHISLLVAIVLVLDFFLGILWMVFCGWYSMGGAHLESYTIEYYKMKGNSLP